MGGADGLTHRAITVALALSGLVAGSAWDAEDGNKLVENCQAYPSGWKNPNDAMTAMRLRNCFGYIWGL
jgi:hypothetical protein